jgi:hypothetical protein
MAHFPSAIGHRPSARWLLLLVLGWLLHGCASPSVDSSAPKPGRGIAQYREVARDAHHAVAATVKSLEALAQSAAQPSLQHPALPGFDRALHELEVTSVKARARAEAIIMRGQAYFDEWKGNLAGLTNQTAAQVERERYSRLLERFEQVRQRSGEVREEFRPFMARLREFRARLDKPATSAGDGTSRQELDGVITAGRRVLTALESVSSALNEAEAELRITLGAKR